MNCKEVERILRETAYVRVGGTAEEERCADEFAARLRVLGLEPVKEAFPITLYQVKKASLTVGGRSIPCTGYGGVANGAVKGRLVYLRGGDDVAFRRCRDKIVLCEKGVGPAALERLLKAGARGYITYSGNLLYEDRDIVPKEYRFDGVAPLPAVHVHTADAFALARKEGSEVEIILEQGATLSASHNLILDLEGEVDETVVVCAHYDSTPFSHGAYDNLSGAIGLLYLAEHFARIPHRRRLRLLWCGSEEKGLLGSAEYARMHPRDNERSVLNINLDMLGSVLGDFVAFSCANEEMREYLESFLRRHRFPGSTRLAIRSSDSNTFVHYGIPAVSFARYAPNFSYPVHTRYDTAQVVSAPRLLKDMALIAAFTEAVLDSDPVPLSVCDEIKSEVETYMKRRPRAVPERSL